jgi:hypothetical protein
MSQFDSGLTLIRHEEPKKCCWSNEAGLAQAGKLAASSTNEVIEGVNWSI